MGYELYSSLPEYEGMRYKVIVHPMPEDVVKLKLVQQDMVERMQEWVTRHARKHQLILEEGYDNMESKIVLENGQLILTYAIKII